ncbi:hypothetical protein ACFLQG_00945 [Candidatus Zixiibacteriota bacterium]
MYCAHCQEKVSSNPIKQGGEYYCSLECANSAAGYDQSENDDYYEEESPIDEHLDEYD